MCDQIVRDVSDGVVDNIGKSAYNGKKMKRLTPLLCSMSLQRN